MTYFSSRLRRFLLASVFVSFCSATFGQVEFPAPSPHGHVEQTVGLTEIEVDYSRPGVKGRVIFGGLVPYEQVWRTGANDSTKLTFSDAIRMAGVTVPAGTYALYTIPREGNWTIILSSKTDLWGAYGYSPQNDFLRFTAVSEKLAEPVETFTIGIADITDSGAKLNLEWETTRVVIPFEADPHQKVMAQLRAAMSNDEPKSPSFLFNAGFYYFRHGEDAKQALDWVNEAIEKRGESVYWMMALKAEILAALERRQEAINTARATLLLAQQADDLGYVKKMMSLLEEVEDSE